MKSLKEAITKEHIAALENIYVAVGQSLSASVSSGIRKSGAKGSSLEFADFRDYSPGDDLRRVDWNGYARFGKMYMKLFTEEKQADINIFVDASESMAFYDDKWLFARLLGVSLGYIGVRSLDRVNIYGLHEEGFDGSFSMQTKASFNRMVEFLDKFSAKGKTDLTSAIGKATAGGMKKGVSFVISDFFSQGDISSVLKLLRKNGQEICLIQVLDKEEITPSLSGEVNLIDCETESVAELDIGDLTMKNYEKALEGMKGNLMEKAHVIGGKYIFVDTQTTVLQTIGFAIE